MSSPAPKSLTFGTFFGLFLYGISPVFAQDDRRWDTGLRFNIIGGSGKPTNDVLGFGIFGRYRLGDRWTVGLAVDVSDEFDIERTPELVGLEQDPDAPVIDSTGSSEGLNAWIDVATAATIGACSGSGRWAPGSTPSTSTIRPARSQVAAASTSQSMPARSGWPRQAWAYACVSGSASCSSQRCASISTSPTGTSPTA